MKTIVQKSEAEGSQKHSEKQSTDPERFTSGHLLMVFFVVAMIFGAIMKTING